MIFSVLYKRLYCTYSAQMRVDQKKDLLLNIIASILRNFHLKKRAPFPNSLNFIENATPIPGGHFDPPPQKNTGGGA